MPDYAYAKFYAKAEKSGGLPVPGRFLGSSRVDISSAAGQTTAIPDGTYAIALWGSVAFYAKASNNPTAAIEGASNPIPAGNPEWLTEGFAVGEKFSFIKA